MTRNASMSLQEKARRRADRIDRTWFAQRSHRVTYLRPPLPHEFEGQLPTTGKRYVLVGLRHGGFVRFPCTMEKEPDTSEATAMALFHWCVEKGRSIAEGTPNHTIKMTTEEARRTEIVVASAITVTHPHFEALIEAGEVTETDVVHYHAAKYDERHPPADEGASE